MPTLRVNDVDCCQMEQQIQQDARGTAFSTMPLWELSASWKGTTVT